MKSTRCISHKPRGRARPDSSEFTAFTCERPRACQWRASMLRSNLCLENLLHTIVLLPLLLSAVTFSLPALAALGDVAPDFVHYANGGVLSTAVQPDGKIIIAGDFGTVEYVNRNGIARVYAEGGLDLAFNPIPNGPVTRTAVQADGKIM